jgi:hypothetical protein
VYTNSGARYDPESDSWMATTTSSGTPTARGFHTAVWTGSEMIVWGGWEGSSRLDTGGRYDPETDSWKPTTTLGVPLPRSSHTAVWTGALMFVWGGSNLNTGGTYDPQRDLWSFTSVGPGVPAQRSRHTAVWTGTEIIVWGGATSVAGPTMNSGGRYDLATESWTATSTGPGVPAGREIHTAVWTGTEMIVWGGAEGGDSFNDGGRYCVCEAGTASTWYPDADGDGYGVDSTAIPACSQPPGYITVGGDCDDSTSDTHPGAVEINDGLDNQCPGGDGHGVVDELSGSSGFDNLANPYEFSWTPQAGATSYEVARSTDRQFVADCVVHGTTTTYWDDGTPVPVDTCFYYLVRATQPNVGSWGASSAGAERTPVCP